MKTSTNRYAGYRFPVEIISYTVWFYHRFTLGFREIEELLACRGVLVSYATLRQWFLKFDQPLTNAIRRRCRPGD